LVIGVAVGAYTTGQNLNFAVPARIALNFIEGGSDKTVDIVTVLGLAKRLSDERAGVEYSADGASAYQRLNRELNASLNQAVDLASSHAQLLDIWQMAGLGSAEEERAARKGVTLAPTSATALELLARTLNGQTIVAESPEAKAALRTEAEKYALMAVANATASERAAPLFTLARIQFGADRAADAYKTYLQIKAPSGTEQARDALLGLFATSRALGRRAEAKRWFDQAAQMKLSIAASQWEDLAEMLEQEPSLGDAAAAYVQAATGATYLYRHYCSAARIYASVNRTDEALGAARQCLDRATKAQDGDSNAQFAHRILSVLLRGRGVIDQAIGHARDAIGIDATDGYAHAALGQALYEAQRYTEAETILRTAIRLTDGGEDFIHFALGLVLFKQEKWSEAQRSFERAAELDPRDDGAAYNVAISLARQSFFRDAAKWYEEALRRNPARSDATELRDRIRELRR
jgi:tetratricopeptide (TPR) repeat protein